MVCPLGIFSRRSDMLRQRFTAKILCFITVLCRPAFKGVDPHRGWFVSQYRKLGEESLPIER